MIRLPPRFKTGRFTGNMPQTDDITFVAVERVIPGAV